MLEKPQRTYCSNPNCPKHTVYSGGGFTMIGKEWYCLECGPNATVFQSGKNLWDFTTTHFNGEPVHVKSLHHLRELENKYGCSNHAANYDSSRWNVPPPVKQAPAAPSFGERHSF